MSAATIRRATNVRPGPPSAKTLLYIPPAGRNHRRPVMDIDQFWSVCAMPIGLLICFGPAILVWLPMELKGPPDDKH